MNALRWCLAVGSVVALGLVAGVGCTNSDSPVDPDELADCGEVTRALGLELTSIQSCSSDAQCGQVLTNTSCGCTRDLVARLDADTDRFAGIVGRGRALQCEATAFATTCDCPAADGFACVDSRCTWNYQ